MKRKITITYDDKQGYDVDYSNLGYEQLMADLVAVTILAGHRKLSRHELIWVIKRFWKLYKGRVN